MFRKRFFYLLEIQYLGFRYHGWQKQPDVITVESMLLRTLWYVLGRKNLKLLAAGRTDAMVSVQQGYVQLILEEEPLPEEILDLLNENLPQDIRVLSLEEEEEGFGILNAVKIKEYVYLFSFGKKYHPFSAPFMTHVNQNLDIALMKKGAKLFEGKHDYFNYVYKPRENTQTQGEIIASVIDRNDWLQASFFPEESYMLRVRSKGFKRHQVRLMMGVLFDLGEGKLDLEFIRKTLEPDTKIKLERIAPASGLILREVVI